MENSEVRLEIIPRLVQDTWSSILGLEIDPSPAPSEDAARRSYTAWLRIIGSQNITVILRCPEPLAKRATAAMYGTGPEEVEPDQVKDSLKEIVNIVGGNVKGMLTKYHFLSMPSVAEPDKNPYFPQDEVLGEFRFGSLGHGFELTLLKAN